MSDLIRISLVCEGPTDEIVFRIALKNALSMMNVKKDFVLTRVQPPADLISDNGNGWKGVRKWCNNAGADSGGLSAGGVLDYCDLLVIHVDADIARDGEIACAMCCPPAIDTIKALEGVLLNWCGTSSMPSKVVFWIPSDNTEAWVWAALYHDSPEIPINRLECVKKPESYLSRKRYSVNGREKKFLERNTKKQRVYQAASADISANWQKVQSACSDSWLYLYQQMAGIKWVSL